MIDALLNPSTKRLRDCSGASPLRALPPIGHSEFQAIRRRLILRHFKWDPQVDDVCTLADFPLTISGATWRQLARDAELLCDEAMEAEDELLNRPELWMPLAAPWRIRRAMRGLKSQARGYVPRIMRFDFHWTTAGWKISEVNSDVPGGFCESSSFTQLMAGHYLGYATAGCATSAWMDAAARVAAGGAIALLCAPGLLEDQQVIAYLAAALRARGCQTYLAGPTSVTWDDDGRAHLGTCAGSIPLGAIIRFYQGEWLPWLRWQCDWRRFFVGSRTPVLNPGHCILLESKRFPLIWDRLKTPLPTWRGLLPQSCDPRDVPWTTDENWILKSAYSNNGDSVIHSGWNDSQALRRARWHIRCFPGEWVAQRRFEVAPIPTSSGVMYPCIGVYTVDGRAVGIYGRMAPKSIVDYSAMDVAVLVDRETYCEGE